MPFKPGQSGNPTGKRKQKEPEKSEIDKVIGVLRADYEVNPTAQKAKMLMEQYEKKLAAKEHPQRTDENASEVQKAYADFLRIYHPEIFEEFRSMLMKGLIVIGQPIEEEPYWIHGKHIEPVVIDGVHTAVITYNGEQPTTNEKLVIPKIEEPKQPDKGDNQSDDAE